jgi:hypothetical protein
MFACCLALVLMGLCLAISARLGAASTGAFMTLNIVYASMGAQVMRKPSFKLSKHADGLGVNNQL